MPKVNKRTPLVNKKNERSVASVQNVSIVPIDEEVYVHKVPTNVVPVQMTLFELNALITARSMRLAAGDSPAEGIDISDMNPNNIAYREILAGKVTLAVRRHLPNGDIKDYAACDMILPNL